MLDPGQQRGRKKLEFKAEPDVSFPDADPTQNG